jgi:hypothetical protein
VKHTLFTGSPSPARPSDYQLALAARAGDLAAGRALAAQGMGTAWDHPYFSFDGDGTSLPPTSERTLDGVSPYVVLDGAGSPLPDANRYGA